MGERASRVVWPRVAVSTQESGSKGMVAIRFISPTRAMVAGAVFSAGSVESGFRPLITTPARGRRFMRMASTVRRVWFMVPSEARATTTIGRPNWSAISRTSTFGLRGTRMPPMPSTITKSHTSQIWR